MATTASFDAVMKRYTPYEMLVEEMKKRNYFWNKVEKDSDWKGGTLEIPYEAAEASSLRFGALTSASDIAEGSYVLGTISTQPELWGTMKFNERDLDKHGDLDQSYLKLIPGKMDQFMRRMSERVSIALLGDGSITAATANGDASGNLTVANPERLTIGEKVVIDDGNSSPVDAYVRTINVNTGVVTFYDARTGGSVVDLSGYTTAQSAKVYHVDQQASGFTSLRSQLLSNANGGSANLFGAAKTTAPFLQSINVSGASFTAATILEDIFGAFFTIHKLGKGNPTEILVSYGLFKNIAKSLETNRQFTVTDKQAGYGWRSVSVIGVDGDMKITALRDMPDDAAYVMDWKAVKFHGHKFFERKRHLDGGEAFLVRNTTGYEYIVDYKFYGDLVVHHPSHCGIIYSIPAAAAA